ncbi:alcohol dehydrogenase superfamily, zinc-containing [Janthinobacterium agaricidamnosum NBRC 102515 = DSM 9628]|uniref:Alcohol dehydrogenase superfamily, zinc-containing n=2 Tax=Janthinobacterium agaricidamnosum TaxID=55508 RepID=W0V8N1_9BURK|nr:alcohol dehydrogenase superfamily, zinc-containing [Janthinobacterium agaricidamnosum NBRC 102515 = DSM 9628]
MSAAVLETFGAPIPLKQVARPVAGPGQVLVRIHASGINPLDLKIAAGQAAHAKVTLPSIPGIDVAGVVEAVGPGVSQFKPGDEVYGMAGGVGGVPGTLAQYGAFDADLLAIKPANMSMHEAATVPLIFITAWEGLVDRARVQTGDTVLVHGGAGGVGHIAVQLARAFGATVYATGKAASKAAIEAAGATAIDYENLTPPEYVEQYTGGNGYDIVYDTVGGATLDHAFRAARLYGGHVVSCLGWGTHALAPLSFRAATYSGVFTLLPLLSGKGRASHGAILRAATGLIEAGKVTIRTDPRRFGLDGIAGAYHAASDGSAQGKLAIDIVQEG